MSGVIVVGVSARTGSAVALRWAVGTAQRLDDEVHAVLAWRPPRAPAAPGGKPGGVRTTGPDDPGAFAQQRLEELVAKALGDQHTVRCRAMRGPAVKVLVEESQTADLVVVDSPRPGRSLAVAAKLVTPQLVYRSACPVVVMPAGIG
jgi:hypothetical protein